MLPWFGFFFRHFNVDSAHISRDVEAVLSSLLKFYEIPHIAIVVFKWYVALLQWPQCVAQVGIASFFVNLFCLACFSGNLYTYQIGLVGLHHSSYRVSARLSVRVVAASAPGFGALKDGTAEVQRHDTACTFG